MEEFDFRFGKIAQLYYEIANQKVPCQMDLLDEWFPGLMILTDSSDGNTKTPAEYQELSYVIHAVKYHGRLYSGGSTRVSQILGRLIGTASGNREKERKTAELMQKHAADCFATDMELTPSLQENAEKRMEKLSDAMLDLLYERIFELLYRFAESRKAASDYDRKTEPFPMDDETFDGVIYNAAYQLHLQTFHGLCNAYLWLLTGSLLRNETGRVLRMYDSSFIAIRRQMSETGELEDKLNVLFHPENYHYTYSGDDLDKRFPGVEWYCDGCGEHLNDQDGFDDHLPEWKCRKCGYVNPLSIEEIYETDEDWQNGVRPTDPVRFAAAIAERRQELENERKPEERSV